MHTFGCDAVRRLRVDEACGGKKRNGGARGVKGLHRGPI
jgi:hypothetical protein